MAVATMTTPVEIADMWTAKRIEFAFPWMCAHMAAVRIEVCVGKLDPICRSAGTLPNAGTHLRGGRPRARTALRPDLTNGHGGVKSAMPKGGVGIGDASQCGLALCGHIKHPAHKVPGLVPDGPRSVSEDDQLALRSGARTRARARVKTMVSCVS